MPEWEISIYYDNQSVKKTKKLTLKDFLSGTNYITILFGVHIREVHYATAKNGKHRTNRVNFPVGFLFFKTYTPTQQNHIIFTY